MGAAAAADERVPRRAVGDQDRGRPGIARRPGRPRGRHLRLRTARRARPRDLRAAGPWAQDDLVCARRPQPRRPERDLVLVQAVLGIARLGAGPCAPDVDATEVDRRVRPPRSRHGSPSSAGGASYREAPGAGPPGPPSTRWRGGPPWRYASRPPMSFPSWSATKNRARPVASTVRHQATVRSWANRNPLRRRRSVGAAGRRQRECAPAGSSTAVVPSDSALRIRWRVALAARARTSSGDSPASHARMIRWRDGWISSIARKPAGRQAASVVPGPPASSGSTARTIAPRSRAQAEKAHRPCGGALNPVAGLDTARAARTPRPRAGAAAGGSGPAPAGRPRT